MTDQVLILGLGTHCLALGDRHHERLGFAKACACARPTGPVRMRRADGHGPFYTARLEVNRIPNCPPTY